MSILFGLSRSLGGPKLGIDAAAAAGRDLGDAVGRALDRMEDQQVQASLRHHATTIQLPLQAPPPAEVCRELMESEREGERRQRFADLVAIAEAGKPRTMRMPLQALAIGDFCLLAMAHEPFAEYHQHVNDICPFKHNMVLGYTNGLECYVATKADYDLGERGGYESSPRGAAFMFQTRLPLAGESEQHLRNDLNTAIQTVKRSSD